MLENVVIFLIAAVCICGLAVVAELLANLLDWLGIFEGDENE